MPEELDGLEKLLMDVQKVIRDNELFIRNLGDDNTLETDCGEEPTAGENADEDSFEEL